MTKEEFEAGYRTLEPGVDQKTIDDVFNMANYN